MTLSRDLKFEDFMTNVFERRPELLKGGCRSEYTWDDLNRCLFGWDPSDGRVRLFDKVMVPFEAYTELVDDLGTQRFRLLKEELYRRLDNGATLILNRLDLKCPRVAEIAAQISGLIGERTVSNGYACFGGGGAFGHHWDTHDVFAVQLIGRKRWKLYEPTVALPLPHQRSADRKHECPQVPIQDVVLEPGDILYVPRGWWHSTETAAKEESFHIAVGVHTLKMRDYATWLCETVMGEHISARRSLKWENNEFEDADFVKAFEREMFSAKNLADFKQAAAEKVRQETSFSIHRSQSIGRGASLSINSPYRQAASGGLFVANGTKVAIDPVSARTLKRALDGELGNLEPREERFLKGLLARDLVRLVN